MKKGLVSLFLIKLKFAASSALATIVDYFLYLLLESSVFSPVISNLISASVGMIINFAIQKRYIFTLKRKVATVFLISVLVSLGGIGLSTLFIYLLNKIAFFNEYQFVTKAIVIGIIFNYNFYFKRFAFEKRFLPELNKRND
ncbi:MAG: hypothetical protein COA32_14690 [Fluviicola sp.]|nr:MAG: hypothetical protein COA32_14690 [Fluviicola sp.]